jgi:uncharacterized protein YgiM (DUF1202 family)
MRRLVILVLILILVSCTAPPPPVPAAAPSLPPPSPVVDQEEKVIGMVRVTASALNVRAEASTTADVVTQVRKGQSLDVLREDDSWVKVRLADGETGWVAARFVASGNTSRKQAQKKGGCPADSDFAFTETPTLAFSDSGAHGIVVVDATVSAKGTVTATKLVLNGTGDETLAFLAEREIKGAKFSPPSAIACRARSSSPTGERSDATNEGVTPLDWRDERRCATGRRSLRLGTIGILSQHVHERLLFLRVHGQHLLAEVRVLSVVVHVRLALGERVIEEHQFSLYETISGDSASSILDRILRVGHVPRWFQAMLFMQSPKRR